MSERKWSEHIDPEDEGLTDEDLASARQCPYCGGFFWDTSGLATRCEYCGDHCCSIECIDMHEEECDNNDELWAEEDDD